MKIHVLLLCPLFGMANLRAETPPPAASATPPPKRSKLLYTPPQTDPGRKRIDGDGGSRTSGAKFPAVFVLAPGGVGLTSREQPSLFYFQAGPSPKGYLKLSIVDSKQYKTLLKASIPLDGKSDRSGILRVQLANLKTSLKPGIRYTWNISLGPLPESGAQDVIASGSIQLTAPDDALKTALEKAAPADKTAIYAANGYWYDALEEISNQLLADPKNSEILALRSDLLKQVGLKEAAALTK